MITTTDTKDTTFGFSSVVSVVSLVVI